MSDWRDRAACLGHDEEMWFSTDPHDQRNAKKICDGCPVILQCEALRKSINARHGMWAGVMRQGEL